MSNNAAVCVDGAEIGRSIAVQAAASMVSPRADMNPILLKPEGDARSQVILNGQSIGAYSAKDYFQMRQRLWPHVTGAIDRLRSEFDLLVMEGAGSPAELNLSGVEIVNGAVARYARSSVILVGDIERGGVFAQILGTLSLMEPEERNLVKGLVVNKFRGDLSLFDSGVEILEQRSGIPVLGVLPWMESIALPQEDALGLANEQVDWDKGECLRIGIIHFPHIANFDDFDPLHSDPRVALKFVREPNPLVRADAIILPGTKNTLSDLEWLRRQGLADIILQQARAGVQVIGICGGFQMLGKTIVNTLGIEGGQEGANGLGLLEVHTEFGDKKITRRANARILDERVVPGLVGQSISGYEIHHGRTTVAEPWLMQGSLGGDGACSADGRVWGCYLHGLFHNHWFLDAWVTQLSGRYGQPVSPLSHATSQESAMDRLADELEKHLDLHQITHWMTHLQEGVYV
jgi:adenosylcobyric acid synthase